VTVDVNAQGTSPNPQTQTQHAPTPAKNPVSAAARKRMAQAQKARWAAIRAQRARSWNRVAGRGRHTAESSAKDRGARQEVTGEGRVKVRPAAAVRSSSLAPLPAEKARAPAEEMNFKSARRA